ncbi:MAG: hypothetical protein V2B20_09780 [Pseudomonadota bacterium]
MKDFFLPYLPLLRGCLCSLFILFLLVACRSGAEHDQSTDHQPHFLVINTFRIPVLATPDDQLVYARSAFEEIEEKSAALQAIRVMHPTSRLHAAMADLELAYLQLGTDYRQADDRQCAVAVEKYQAILRDYSDFPDIAAKALWYLGWIACDLQHDKHQGLKYFKEIVDKFPREIVTFLPPAPWLTIRPTIESIEPQPFFPTSPLTWEALAHLEIIRHSENSKEAWQSFFAISEMHDSDGLTGLALKTLVNTHGFTSGAELQIRKYLAYNTADKDLRDDLLLALTDYLRHTSLETGTR